MVFGESLHQYAHPLVLMCVGQGGLPRSRVHPTFVGYQQTGSPGEVHEAGVPCAYPAVITLRDTDLSFQTLTFP
jgi:hypothetical protein